MASARLACVSVDIDEIPCYTAIHGLPEPEGARREAIYDKALPRLVDLFDDQGVHATFFAIGRDLATEGNGARLRDLVAGGHEIANHSQDHLYDLTRRSPSEMRAQVSDAQDALEDALGERPVGFRAPGYTITDALFEILEAEGLSYDSSVFPCPAYYGAKTAAIGAIAARGRRSHSVVDDPRVLLAPADPYRVGRPYWRRGGGLLEQPIGVTRGARLPFIGTSAVLAGERGADLLARQMSGRPLVTLELHGIDLADAEADDLGFLAPHQPDLRASLERKHAALRAAISRLRQMGYAFVTHAEAASRFG